MQIPLFTDPQFLDASATGGLNPAFGVVSGALGSVGSGVWAVPGLIAPEAMAVTASGMIANVTLNQPWGLVSSGGVVVRAHGTQTGIDTQAYTVSFASLVPGSGSRTAYLAATVTSIQQAPVPVPGPPPGHPAYDPTFVPTVVYTVNEYSVALAAVTGGIDNINTFELARTTLTAGQVNLGTLSAAGVQRVPVRNGRPIQAVGAGGTLLVAQAQYVLVAVSGNITSTLNSSSACAGLTYAFVNATSGVWTISTTTGDTIVGFGATGLVSVAIPASGSMTVWCDAIQNAWSVVGSSPNIVPHGLISYESAGTYSFTVPQNVTQIRTRLWAAGGSGQGSTDEGYPGGGGGGGGYAEGTYPVTPGQVITVIVGSGTVGGNGQLSSIGSLIAAGGGIIGGAGSTGSAGVGGSGGSSFSGAAFAIPGATAAAGIIYSANALEGGQGGGSFGSQGNRATGSASAPFHASSGQFPGGGSSGCNGDTNIYGAAGAAGAVIIEY